MFLLCYRSFLIIYSFLGFSNTSRLTQSQLNSETARASIHTVLSEYPQPFSNPEVPITICNEILFRGTKWLINDLNDPTKHAQGKFEYCLTFDYNQEEGSSLSQFMNRTVPDFFIEDLAKLQDMSENEFRKIE